MKISCSMIVKNEAVNLRACLESVRPHVDELVIVDTGSTDETPQIAREYADKFEVFLDCNDPETGLIEDFSAARNRSLELCTHEWLFWIDGDDVLIGGENLRALAASVTEDNVHFLFPYDYQHDEAGNCIVRHLRERLIFPRHRSVWQLPIHEACLPAIPMEGDPLVAIPVESVRIVHQDRAPKEREATRNLRILEKHHERSGEGDPRTLYYLGLEYGLANRIGDCMRALRRYIELTTWREEERCLAMLDMARCFQSLNDHDVAIEWASKALMAKSWSAPYFVLAQSFYALGMRGGPDAEYQFRRCVNWAQRGIEINPEGKTETVQTMDPQARFQVQRVLSIALSRLGRLDETIRSCEAGLSGLPGDELLQNNLRAFKRERARRHVSAAMEELQTPEESRAIIRATLAGDIQVQLLERPTAMPANVETTQKQPGKLDLVFFVGHGLEPWTPETVRKGGMGGSETMVMELGKRLAKMGHRVRVYAHATASMEGLYDGMEWYDASRYHDLECDVLIASRRPDAVDDAYRVKAGARVLWIHDVHCGEALDMQRDLRIDRILALSEWHKNLLKTCYPRVNPAKILVTRNGIDLERFKRDVPRNPHRVVYSSSPDRGLENLLEMWPEIRKRVPDAELRIFYGFENWEKVAQMMNDDAQKKKIRHLQHLCKALPGVTLVGRISQGRLAEEFLSAGVWAYPTWFEETSCITAMEAQAAGLFVTTSALAALNETAEDMGHLVDGDPRTAEYRAAFVGHVVDQLGPDDPSIRAISSGAARRFSLESLATDWDKMLLEIHETVTSSVVPPFHSAEVA